MVPGVGGPSSDRVPGLDPRDSDSRAGAGFASYRPGTDRRDPNGPAAAVLAADSCWENMVLIDSDRSGWATAAPPSAAVAAVAASIFAAAPLATLTSPMIG